VRGRPVDDREGHLAAGIAPRAVAEQLIRTYLQQVLRDGFFHADPHPGNVFVDDAGRLVYVDFGMMGEITPADRRAMGRFAAGVVQRDLDGLVQALRDLSFLRPHAEAAPLKRALAVALDQMAGVQWSRAAGAAFDEFLDEMREFLRSEPFQLPTQYTFLGRAAGILLGITSALEPNLDMVRLLQNHAFGYLGLPGREGAAPGAAPGAGAPAPGLGGIPGLSWDTVGAALRDLALLLYRFPQRVDRLLERAENGDLRLRVELSTVARRMDEGNRARDRLTRALLAIAAGGLSTWLLIAGRLGDARAGWVVTALLLVWTARGGAGAR